MYVCMYYVESYTYTWTEQNLLDTGIHTVTSTYTKTPIVVEKPLEHNEVIIKNVILIIGLRVSLTRTIQTNGPNSADLHISISVHCLSLSQYIQRSKFISRYLNGN